MSHPYPGLSDDEDQVPRLAVAALDAAQREALASGLPVVMVIGDRLCRVQGNAAPVVLKTLPPRSRVRDRVKYASS